MGADLVGGLGRLAGEAFDFGGNDSETAPRLAARAASIVAFKANRLV
jgi:hypothetical protein